jgi:MerC mercury resistance protein
VKLLSLDPDRLGTIASTVCAIHCAVTGIAVSVLSLVGFRYLQSPFLEWVLLGLALLFGSWAAARGYGIHKQRVPIVIFGLGLLLLFGSHLVWPGHGTDNSKGFSELFSVIGGVCLVGFHYLNRQFINARI